MHVALDYGFVRATLLLFNRFRLGQVEWFREKYTRNHKEGSPPPSIIAHSFGTYIVARALQRYPEIVVGRVIFCGSIVDRNYRWSSLIDGGRCEGVLNDFGRKDFWAGIAKYRISDADDSGVQGFTDAAGGRVIQREHPEFRHSDYFYELNYRRNWIPFLLGNAPGPLNSEDKPGRNWRYTITNAIIYILALAALACLAWLLWPVPEPPKPPPVDDQTTFPQMASDILSKDFEDGLKTYEALHEDKRVTWDARIYRKRDDGYKITPVPVALSGTAIASYFAAKLRRMRSRVLVLRQAR